MTRVKTPVPARAAEAVEAGLRGKLANDCLLPRRRAGRWYAAKVVREFEAAGLVVCTEVDVTFASEEFRRAVSNIGDNDQMLRDLMEIGAEEHGQREFRKRIADRCAA